MSEKSLCNAIVEFLNYQGNHVWRTNAGMLPAEYNGKKRMMMIGKRGISDIIGVSKNGQFIALEVKLPSTRNRVTAHQLSFLESIESKGGIAAVVTSPEEALEVVENKASDRMVGRNS